MTTTLFVLLALAALALLWSESRAMAETAARLGREACARAGVQWLDHSMALTRIALRRGDDGRLRVLRQYRFDYSRQGDDRASGSLALLGRDLLWISAPPPVDGTLQ
jgi:hypothetical protein